MAVGEAKKRQLLFASAIVVAVGFLLRVVHYVWPSMRWVGKTSFYAINGGAAVLIFMWAVLRLRVKGRGG